VKYGSDLPKLSNSDLTQHIKPHLTKPGRSIVGSKNNPKGEHKPYYAL